METFEERLQKLQEQVNMLERKIYRRSCDEVHCPRAGTIKILTQDGIKLRLCGDHVPHFLGCWILGRFGRKVSRIE
jgi:predicted secreted protein